MANIFDLFKKIEKQSPHAGPITHLVVGLGNPGAQYATTRHNAGFLAVDRIAERLSVRVDRVRFRALTGEGTLAGVRVLFLKPQTFMNLSGESVREAAAYYHIPPENIVVLYDDVCLPVGRLRVRAKGSDGGHNGMKSIIARLGTEEFPRVRIGIGEKPSGWDLADYVLGRFPAEEEPLMREALADAARACELFVMDELSAAMNLFNKKKKQENNESISGTIKGDK